MAGQVAGTSVTTSPLSYNTMASQCEALGTGTRKKLSNWLAHENQQSTVVEESFPTFPVDGRLALKKVCLLLNLLTPFGLSTQIPECIIIIKGNSHRNVLCYLHFNIKAQIFF